MSRHWWQLPGVTGFIQNLLSDLRDGKNLIICLPENTPDGLYYEVSRELEQDRYWQQIDLSDHQAELEPVAFLYDRFTDERTELRTLKALCDLQDFQGRGIWIRNIALPQAKTWLEFITDYQHACAAYPLLNRTLICLELVGQAALDTPLEDVRLAKHYWNNILDWLDIHLYVSTLYQKATLSTLIRTMAVAVTVRLALWDKACADFLAEQPIDYLLKPEAILASLAQQKRWLDMPVHPPCWHKGMKQTFAGMSMIHTALMSCLSPQEVKRRIWQAQVSTLLPFIEDERLRIVEEIRAELKVPFKPEYGDLIEDAAQLEIGHIFFQTVRNFRIPHDTRNRIEILKGMRNQLAHLELVEFDTLQAYEKMQKHADIQVPALVD